MTALLAAGATPPAAGPTVLAGLAIVAAVTYTASCTWWPFGRCRRCKGAGRLARSDGRVFRLCPRCKSTGRRLRVGRRLWNAINDRRREGTR